MKLFLLQVIFLACIGFQAFAQGSLKAGFVVKSEKKVPLKGVKVKISERNGATQLLETGADGAVSHTFSLNAEYSVLFSLSGYEDHPVSVNTKVPDSKKNLNYSLPANAVTMTSLSGGTQEYRSESVILFANGGFEYSTKSSVKRSSSMEAATPPPKAEVKKEEPKAAPPKPETKTAEKADPPKKKEEAVVKSENSRNVESAEKAKAEAELKAFQAKQQAEEEERNRMLAKNREAKESTAENLEMVRAEEEAKAKQAEKKEVDESAAAEELVKTSAEERMLLLKRKALEDARKKEAAKNRHAKHEGSNPYTELLNATGTSR